MPTNTVLHCRSRDASVPEPLRASGMSLSSPLVGSGAIGGEQRNTATPFTWRAHASTSLHQCKCRDHGRTAPEWLGHQRLVLQRLVVDADADLLYTRCLGFVQVQHQPVRPCPVRNVMHRRSRKSSRRLQQANMSHRLERHQHRGVPTVHGFRPTGWRLQCRGQPKSVLTHIPVARRRPGIGSRWPGGTTPNMLFTTGQVWLIPSMVSFVDTTSWLQPLQQDWMIDGVKRCHHVQ